MFLFKHFLRVLFSLTLISVVLVIIFFPRSKYFYFIANGTTYTVEAYIIPFMVDVDIVTKTINRSLSDFEKNISSWMGGSLVLEINKSNSKVEVSDELFLIFQHLNFLNFIDVELSDNFVTGSNVNLDSISDALFVNKISLELKKCGIHNALIKKADEIVSVVGKKIFSKFKTRLSGKMYVFTVPKSFVKIRENIFLTGNDLIALNVFKLSLKGTVLDIKNKIVKSSYSYIFFDKEDADNLKN